MNTVVVTITPLSGPIVRITPPVVSLKIISFLPRLTLKVSPLGAQGPQGLPGLTGPQGPAAGETTYTAGETISGGKAVMVSDDGKAYVYNILNENNYGKMCGIAKQAGLAGDPIAVFTNGIAYEAGAGWLPGKIYYVSQTGLLTTIYPTAGIVKKAGVGVGIDKVLIDNSLEVITI